MIEVTFSNDITKKFDHEIHAVVRIMDAMRKAGIPIVGTLHFRGVERGYLTWTLEEDLDDDAVLIRWWDVNDPCPVELKGVPLRVVASGNANNGEGLNGFKWRRFVPVDYDDPDEI